MRKRRRRRRRRVGGNKKCHRRSRRKRKIVAEYSFQRSIQDPAPKWVFIAPDGFCLPLDGCAGKMGRFRWGKSGPETFGWRGRKGKLWCGKWEGRAEAAGETRAQIGKKERKTSTHKRADR